MNTNIIIFNDLHKIYIPFTNLGRNDEFVSIFLPGVNWFSHCNKCESCKSFLNDVGKISNWVIQINDEIKAIDLNTDFGDEKISFTGLIKNSTGVSNRDLDLNTNFCGTKIRFKVFSLNDGLNNLITYEQYEKCIFYRDVLNIEHN